MRRLQVTVLFVFLLVCLSQVHAGDNKPVEQPFYDEPLGEMDLSKFKVGEIVSGPELTADDIYGKVIFYYRFSLN